MKRSVIQVLAVGVTLLTLTQNSPAIPQDFGAVTFGGGGAPLGAGAPGGGRAQGRMFLEDLLRKEGAFADADKLPGDWKTSADNPDAKVVTVPGNVFGVKADTATMTAAKDRSVKEIRVAYSAKGAGLTVQQLWDRLQKNVGTYVSGGSKTPSASTKHVGSNMAVELKQVTDGVVAQVTAAPKTATPVAVKAVTPITPRK